MNISLDTAAPSRAVKEPPLPTPSELLVFEIFTIALTVKVLESKDNESMANMGLVPLPTSTLLGDRLLRPVPLHREHLQNYHSKCQ